MAFLDLWKRWKTRAILSVRKRGVTGTVILAAGIAKALCMRLHPWNAWNPWYRRIDRQYDRQFGVETAAILRLPELESDPRFQFSEQYDPTPGPIFFRLLRQIDLDYGKFVFIDLGCGKGKVLLLASELPFKQIVGVELSSNLIGVAEANLRSYRGGPRQCNAIQLVCMDAGEYPIPDGPALIYSYNSFQEAVMRKVLENIRSSLAAAPREIYFVYYNPVFGNLLDESGFLEPLKRTPWYAIYRASGERSSADAHPDSPQKI